jgi:hypothetical protein
VVHAFSSNSIPVSESSSVAASPPSSSPLPAQEQKISTVSPQSEPMNAIDAYLEAAKRQREREVLSLSFFFLFLFFSHFLSPSFSLTYTIQQTVYIDSLCSF